jgi:hypothetical protein
MAAAQAADHKLTAPAVVLDREAAPRRDGRAASASDEPHASADYTFARLFGLGIGVFMSGLEAQASLLAYGAKSMPVGPFFQAQVTVAEAALKFAAELITVPGHLA